MIDRHIESDLLSALDRFPAVGLIGPRQVGKTTLARKIAATRPDTLYLDLERPSDMARIREPELLLGPRCEQLVIIDEIQNAPALFPVLRALIDEHRVPGRFLLLGSASPVLINRSAESLAGRIRYLEMTPLTLAETGATPDNLRLSWLRGGFPDAYTAATDADAFEWQEAFVRTYVERDIPNPGYRVPPQSLHRFWQMLAHWHGQVWNASTLAKSLDASPQTANRYLDLLCGAFVARRLQPFTANLGKRLIKAPKTYLRDSGLLHYLLNIASLDQLEGHPVLGASWEGFVIEQILASLPHREANFFRTSNGAELDLVLQLPGQSIRHGIEVKYSAAPKPGKGFWHTLDDLAISRAVVIYPGNETYPLEKRVTAWPARRIPELADFLLAPAGSRG
jgi:predicted AAA+ superfamily ATPase